MRILFIDDDMIRSRKIVAQLDPTWSSVELSTVERAMELLHRQQDSYELIAIAHDRNSSRSLSICSFLRSSGCMPPVVFYGEKLQIAELERVYESGADDYVIYPFNHLEFQTRIDAFAQRSKSMMNFEMTVGVVTLNPHLRVISCGLRTSKLSEIESTILSFLIAYFRQSFTAAELFHRLWNDKSESSIATVRVHINSLRKKLSEIGASNFIRTVRGKGYMVYE